MGYMRKYSNILRIKYERQIEFTRKNKKKLFVFDGYSNCFKRSFNKNKRSNRCPV